MATATTSEAVTRPAPEPGDWLLRVEDLRVHFDTRRGVVEAVDGVSFDIRPGETLAVVGETGCGKSVTARSLMRLVPQPPGRYPTGRVLLRDPSGGSGGEPVDLLRAPLSQVRAVRGDRIAMIFQDPGKALNPSLTIGRQVAEVFGEHRWREMLDEAGHPGDPGPFLREVARQRAAGWRRGVAQVVSHRASRDLRRVLDDRVRRALADTGIPNAAKVMTSYPHELSGGMKQRVMIAQALACDPDLLIADEPTTALDVTIQARIFRLIADLQRRRGTAILYITHDLSLVRHVADRLAVMYAGRIAEVGPADRVLRAPQHPYTQGLLAAIPHARTPRGRLAAIPGTVPQLVAPPPQCHFHSRCPHAAPACRALVPPLLAVADAHEAACLRHAVADDVPGTAPADLPVPATRTPDAEVSR
jgi:oligopeptide/dipeptide ABC transporter ATP-binding protein